MNRNRKPTDTTRTFFRFLLSMVASGRSSKNRENKVPITELLVGKSQQQPDNFLPVTGTSLTTNRFKENKVHHTPQSSSPNPNLES